MTIRRMTIVGSRLASNGVGRAFCLYLLGCHLGWEVTYCCVGTAGTWTPLRGSDFQDVVQVFESTAALASALEEAGSDDHLLVVTKPNPARVHLGRNLSGRMPVLYDVDDPDLIVRIEAFDARRKLGLVNPATVRDRTHPWNWIRMDHMLRRSLPTIVSNPALQSIYGGEVVPHARTEVGTAAHERRELALCFVGTPKAHKGIGELRRAVMMLAAEQELTLTITANPPTDAQPWECWVGETSLAEGLAIVQESTMVCIPSRDGTWGRHQLPVKLVDALFAGRPLIASNLPPLRWAAGDAAVYIRPGDVGELAAAIRSVAQDPAKRKDLGARAVQQARSRFLPDTAAPALAQAAASLLTPH